jgi:hypothetical protein
MKRIHIASNGKPWQEQDLFRDTERGSQHNHENREVWFFLTGIILIEK